MPTVFIDGHEGTTGLQIRERLAGRADLALMEIPSEHRKDPAVKVRYLNEADVVVLCLPDDAARESVALVRNPATRVIDTSTAHRTAPDWTYGMPELQKGQRERIRAATRVSNPGCHATGFVLAVRPLVESGVVPADHPLVCYSITGYSGGGKKLIAAYTQGRAPADPLHAPRPYALALKHKHVPEMQALSGVSRPPLFVPIAGDFYKGMAVSVPLVTAELPKKPSIRAIHNTLAERYRDERFVRVLPLGGEAALDAGFLSPEACNGTNRLELVVFGNDTHVLIVARFDNLGKGASGAAVQNLNIMLGVDEGEGLTA
jgi:N-acetyl-gamma-glutamyl-phosphate reductase